MKGARRGQKSGHRYQLFGENFTFGYHAPLPLATLCTAMQRVATPRNAPRDLGSRDRGPVASPPPPAVAPRGGVGLSKAAFVADCCTALGYALVQQSRRATCESQRFPLPTAPAPFALVHTVVSWPRARYHGGSK